MFKKGEASRRRHEFWTTFGRYMGPILSSAGVQINWINYHTGVKGIFFRMNASTTGASICISIEQQDRATRLLYFRRLQQLQEILRSFLGEEWEWQADVDVDGRKFSRVSKTLNNVSVLNRDHWPDIISFLKPRIIALDAFWENGRYTFDDIRASQYEDD